jgi:hypothetical protein
MDEARAVAEVNLWIIHCLFVDWMRSRLRIPKGQTMTDTALDEVGPVDYVVVEFPAGATNFTGEMAEELAALVAARTT